MRSAAAVARAMWLSSVVLAACLVVTLAPDTRAQIAGGEGGTISGTLTDQATKEPLAFANVVVVGTSKGAQSDLNGVSVIKNVPPGTYTVRVTLVGYATGSKDNVRAERGTTTSLDFALKESAVEMKEVEVVVEKTKVDVETSASERSFSTEDAKVRVVNTVEDALATQAGVVSVGGNLYVRGGRSDEVKYYVDGVSVTDPLVGAASLQVSLASLEDVNLLSGGFDAEFGNAQSGVVQLVTKEGTPKFSGMVKYMTDDFGAPDKTYFNFDNVLLGAGGPTPVKGLTYYMSGEGVFSDTYLKTGEIRPRRKFLGFEFRERQRDLFSGQAKLSYKFGGTKKLVGEVLFSDESYDAYNHRRSRVGFWSPTAGPGGTGMWWFEPLDSTFTYYNAPEHTPNRRSEHEEYKLRFTHTKSDATFYTSTLALHRFFSSLRVKDKAPTEYDYTSGSLNDFDPLNRFYIIRGDAAEWREQRSSTYTMKADLTSQRGDMHKFKGGFQLDYFDLKLDERRFPSPQDPYGLFPDRYHVGAWDASLYAQDRLKYEGMVLNAGLRLDMFDPSGEAYERANQRRQLLGLAPKKSGLLDRLIYQLSPRLGMAYPISDRDVLHFHYGRFQEVPRLENLYQHTGAGVKVGPGTLVGNSFLDAKTTISYEVGVEHQFWGMSVINLTFFYRDIFGWIGTDQEEAGAFDPRNPPGITFVNLDYGSSQGVEFSLRKHMTPTGRWSGGVTYTYSQARGSSSSETQGFNVLTGGQDRAPITELPLDYDRPHVLSGNLYVTQLGVWGLNLEGSYSSGSPYTPQGLYDKEILVRNINKGRLPDVMDFSFKGDKRYEVYGQEFSLFLEGRNITNRKNVFFLNPAGSIYYNVYYTDFRQLGGAYNLRDVRQDLNRDVLLPLHDPQVYDEPRSFRAGIQFDW